MATAGLSFDNPLAPSGGVPSPVVNPYELRNPASTSGLGGMGDGLADISVMGARAANMFAGMGAGPSRPRGPSIGYSPSLKKFAVQGVTFDEDDAQRALESEQLLGGPPTGLPTGDWVPLTTQQYGQYLQSIRQPGLGTLASKSFGRGVDVTQMLAGRGLQLAGAEELGGRIVERQMEDLRKTSPYERQFTDIESGSDAIDWLVANAAQQGPNIIESIVTGALGFLAGTVSSGNPLGGAAASVASLIGKESWKNSVKSALAKKAAGKALTENETRVLRNAAGLGMMTAATFGQNMATGAADIYGEFRERGADANDVSARLMALGGSVPYALLETLPEALFFGRLMGSARPELKTLPTTRARAGEVLRRGAVGGGVGGLSEGVTELGQESLLLGLTDQELGSPENVNRLINSFAAGFAIGGPIGAGVNIVNPSNLLQPGASTDPVAGGQSVQPTLPANAPRGTQGELFAIAPGEMAGPAFSVLPTPPTTGITPAQPGQMEMFLPSGTQEELFPIAPGEMAGPAVSALPARATLGVPPQPGQMALFGPTTPPLLERGVIPQGPMAQGQLALLGGQVAPGYVPPTMFAPEVPAAPGLTPQEAAAQGALQFAPAAPAPTGGAAVGNALQLAIRRQQEQQMLAQRQAQEAAQREADMQRAAQMQQQAAAAQAQQQELLQAQMGPFPLELPPRAPMVPVRTEQPQQMPLFGRREAPFPSRAEGLRRGVGTQLPPEAAPGVAPAFITLLTADVLDSLGLPKGSKFYKALLGKNMADPAQQAEIAQVFADARESKTVKQSTKNAIEQLAMQAFGALATQQDMFGLPAPAPAAPPRRRKRRAVQEPSAAPVPAQPAPEAGPGVGAQVPAVKQAAPKGVALKVAAKAKAPAVKKPLKKAAAPAPAPKLPKPKVGVVGQLALEAQKAAGWNPDWPFIPADLTNPDFRQLLRDDPSLPIETKQQIFEAGYKLGVVPAAEARIETPAPKPLRKPPAPKGEAAVTPPAPTPAPAPKPRAAKVTFRDDRGTASNESVTASLRVIEQDDDIALEDESRVGAVMLENIYRLDGGQPGRATELLQAITKWADDNQKTLVLMPSGEIAGSRENLKSWYARNGFVEQADGAMVRKLEAPAPTTAADLVAALTGGAAPAAAPAVSLDIEAEAQWNEARVVGDVAFVDLPRAAKDRWIASDRSGDALTVIVEDLKEDLNRIAANGYAVTAARIRATKTEWLNYAQAAASAAMDDADIDSFEAAIPLVVKVAYDPPDGFSVEQQGEALDFLSDDSEFNNAETAIIQDSFVLVFEGQTKEATVKTTKTGTGKAGANKPWYTYAKRIPGMIQRLGKVSVVFKGLPDTEAKQLLQDGLITRANLPASVANKILGVEVSAKVEAEAQPQGNPLTELLEEITKLNSSTTALNTKAQENAKKRLTNLYAAAQAADLDTAEVDDYFRAAGTPYATNIDGLFRVLVREDFDNRVALEAASRAERKAADAARRGPTISTFDDWEADGRFFTDGNKPLVPMPVGRINMSVRSFLSKLFIKPTVHVFRSQADLLARNPQLHARAAAARAVGDFDITPAAGYSFGNGEVIIFTDRIRTEQQLRFVLAHEALGHFGLRSIIPKAEFTKLMDDIYRLSPNVQFAVDAAMDARGLSKAEAVEEYLSDFAAALDVSYIARIWNAIKGALNKLGVQFGDEAARYWVDQSRRYLRTGQVGTPFTVQDVFQRMQAIETGQDPDNSGRYVREGDVRMDNLRAASLLQDAINGMPSDLTSAFRMIRGQYGNTADSFDRFLAQTFSLMNFRARENAGAYEVDRTLRQGRGIAMQVRNALNEKLQPLLSRAVEIPGLPWKFGGITTEQYDATNKLLYAAQRLKFSTIPTTKELGRTPLYTVNPTTGELAPNQPEIDRLYNMGLLTLEQARDDGFTYRDTYMEAGVEKTETVKVPGIPGLTEDSPVWKAYIASREAMRDVELQLLAARYMAVTQERDLTFREIATVTRDGKLTKDEREFFNKIYNQYRDLWIANPIVDDKGRTAINPDSMEKANKFLAAFNTALIAKEKEATDAVAKERNDELRKFLAGPADDLVASIEKFKDRFILSDETRFLVQNRMKDLIVADVSNDGADVATRRNLAGGYTPVLRRGGFQLRVGATVKGKAVRLKQEYKDQLVYAQFETRDEAVEYSKRINDLFRGEGGKPRTYRVEAFNEDTLQYELMDVELSATPGAVLDGIAAPPELNLNDFTRGLRRFSIALPPRKLEEVVVALTDQNDRARQRLERNFVPGADPDAGRAVAEHIEARASTIAKIMMRPRLAELTNFNFKRTRDLWMGDATRLENLKQNWEEVSADPNASVEKKLSAKRDYDFYALQYNKTNPMVKGVRVERGNQYFNEAAQALDFLENNKVLEESGWAAGKRASQIRAATSYMQLGGSLATGALNVIGAFVNTIPYMATYSQTNAFGGGFGFGRTVAEFSRALSQVGLVKAVRGQLFAGENINTAEFYDRVVESEALQKKYRLTPDEAAFLAREIREGEMIPALSNATTNTARGRVQSGTVQKFLDTWMWTFNSTEQAVRRAAGLSTYRLEKQRALAAGAKEADAIALAREAAVNTLRFTMGDYSVMNRPPLWRNGVLSFVYIYKTYPTMSIQLLKRLPRQGQIYMLFALWMLGGLTAFPFAEDIEDILDTIAQALGFTKTSVRYEIAKIVDEIVPGMSPYFLRGVVNAYFPGNVADRVSLGNFLPGTGVLLAGANAAQELTDIAGPAVSMLAGTATSVVDAVRAVATERVTFVDLLRESPVTMFRALGDAIAYTQSGAIVDKRGYVVEPDVAAAIIATRLLGFYPAAATQQYDAIRVAKRMTDYQKEVVAGFRYAWIKAKIQGNEEQAANIVQEVEDWNEGARGTALEIRNFLGNASRALVEAQRPAGERFLRTTARAAREDVATVADLLGY